MAAKSLRRRLITFFAAVMLAAVATAVVGELGMRRVSAVVQALGVQRLGWSAWTDAPARSATPRTAGFKNWSGPGAVSTETDQQRVASAFRDWNGRTWIALIFAFAIVLFVAAFLIKRTADEDRYLSRLIENVSEVVAVISADRKIEYVNPAIESVLGYTQAEIISAGTLTTIHPDDVVIVAHELARLESYPDSGGTVQTVRHRHKDGRWLTMEGIVRKLRSTKGRYVYVLTLRDVTNRRDMERALVQSEEHLQYLANGTFEGLNVIEDGRIISCNDRILQMFGFERSDFIGKPAIDLVAPESRPLVERHRGEEIVDYELVAVRRDGSRFPAQVLRRPMTYFGRPADIVAIRDITDRKRSEEALRIQESRYRSLVETMRDMLISLSADGNIVTLNAAFESTLGSKRSEWVGRSFYDLVHPDDADGVRATIAAAFSGRDTPPHEFRMKRETGSMISAEMDLAPQRDGAPVVGVIATIRDVTERKRLEEQLRRAERLESLGAVASGIAHDLNNVLSPILLSAEVLKVRSSDETLRQIIETVEQSAHRGSDVVKQILSFARGSTGDHSPQFLRHIVREVATLLTPTLESSTTLKTDFPPDLRPIAGDATQLMQLFMNLGVNARDAMPGGGSIRIAGRNLTVTQDSAELRPLLAPGEWVCITVSDTGVGIPDELKERIFDPFFTTKESGKGTGLGLSAVARIVADHHGVLSFDTEVDRGTTFSVYFPAMISGKVFDAGAAPQSIPRGNGELIMVVDDERSLLQTARDTLETFGYRTVGAANGVEALEQFEGFTPGTVRIALLDLHTPMIGGDQTATLLRRMDPGVKIIMMSGTLGSDEARVRNESADAFLEKPFAGERLLELIRQLLAVQ